MSAATLEDLSRYLASGPDAQLPGLSYYRADLRDADLSSTSIACLSLRGAILDGADLRNASLSHVDLSDASLNGARLAGAAMHMVSARGASLRSADARGSFWDIADLTGANLTDLDGRETVFRTCVLERADFDRADLSGGRIDHCTCTEARFCDVQWTGVSTPGSRFRGADLTGGRNFARCRELVAWLLDPFVDEGPEAAGLVGAVAVDAGRCYPEWATYLAEHPEYAAAAAALFAHYPLSGISEELGLPTG